VRERLFEDTAGMDRAQGQLTLDDLGTPLADVTFCVIDLETTGGSPTECGITEVGAVKLRGGECLGTFQTLVNPGRAIPPEITVLTGITHAMVVPAPRIEQVLPALLEFVGEAVIVGHNVRFDVGFLQAALERDERPRLRNRTVDTVALARRLVRDEVPNCKLGTLADRLRLDHKPSHRALDDALATGDLLHLLLERAGGLGVTGLDDLLALPTMAGHAQAAKLRLTDGLPRSPGVYVFRGTRGEVLYVGKATNLRSRVRSYFSGDERRKIGALLRETQRIDHVVHPHPLSAAVHEVRLIHRFTPRYNRQSKDWSKYVYVKLTLDEAFPRLSVVKT
jgi:DNA polymerase III subunit epsilon